ncbi:hypothetical protein BGX34_001208 [Mortierella sp. NVP85]|nr:hypothetical protein BGX34_001208 [Mortierella sp. NVP85]
MIEGWLITFVYGPLMSILMEIPGTILNMTEYKISGTSVAYDLTKLTQDWINGSLDYRHDAILRVEKSGMDVMVMEAKPGSKGSEEDLDKLGIVLSNIILGIKEKYPDIKVENLRVHGIMIIGYRAKLIEARLMSGNPVLFNHLLRVGGPIMQMDFSMTEYRLTDNIMYGV